ncbi:MAG TPA: 4-hydroxybutyrate CoA-transferase, partial [Desulfobacteria bacterium]|nr:4-hydroxybutyrate CoA-transferase [Desulfobacteria bacterium]
MNRDWTRDAVSAEEAVGLLQSGMNVFVHGAAATPAPLLDSMVRRKELEGIRLYHMHTSGDAPFVGPGCEGRFFSISLFTGAALRKPVEEGRADFMPIFLSDIPALFQSGTVKLDAALLQVSPPDAHGCCTLGTSVDSAKSAADHARVIVAEINEQMPRTHGNTVVPFERISAFVHTDRPLIEQAPETETEVEARIGEIVAGLVE